MHSVYHTCSYEFSSWPLHEQLVISDRDFSFDGIIGDKVGFVVGDESVDRLELDRMLDTVWECGACAIEWFVGSIVNETAVTIAIVAIIAIASYVYCICY